MIDLDVRSLSLLRILVGMTLMGDSLWCLANAPRLYMSPGMMTIASQLNDWQWAGILHVTRSSTFISLMLLAYFGAAVAVTVGAWTRRSGVCSWLLFGSVVARAPFARGQADVVLAFLAMFVWLLPGTDALSLDRVVVLWRSKGARGRVASWTVSGIAPIAVWATVLTVEWCALRWRLHSASPLAASWRSGAFFSDAASVSDHPSVSLVAYYVMPLISPLPVFLTLWYMYAVPALVLTAALPVYLLRSCILIACAAVDLSTALFLTAGWLSYALWVAMIVRLALLPPWFWDTLSRALRPRSGRVSLFVDRSHPIGVLSTVMAQLFLLSAQDEVVSAASPENLRAVAMSSDDVARAPHRAVHLALRDSADGRLVVNAAAFASLLRRGALLRPVAALLAVPSIAAYVDRLVFSRRVVSAWRSLSDLATLYSVVIDGLLGTETLKGVTVPRSRLVSRAFSVIVTAGAALILLRCAVAVATSVVAPPSRTLDHYTLHSAYGMLLPLPSPLEATAWPASETHLAPGLDWWPVMQYTGDFANISGGLVPLDIGHVSRKVNVDAALADRPPYRALADDWYFIWDRALAPRQLNFRTQLMRMWCNAWRYSNVDGDLNGSHKLTLFRVTPSGLSEIFSHQCAK